MDRHLAQDFEPLEAPLLLPSSGFYADESLGTGHVQLADDFFALDPACQLGILAGWRGGVERMWRRSLVESFRDGVGGDPGRPLPERIEQFRRWCAVQGIELPCDFALALQQF
jgi:hypothetical protein